MAFGPALAANMPPVAAPEMMEFHGSSFCRMVERVQSQQVKRPPQTANWLPMMGARVAVLEMVPVRQDPVVLLMIVCHVN